MAKHKTTSEVIDDVIEMIKLSSLASSVSGSIYKGQNRPIGSKLEDIVVNCINSDSEQIQEFSININVFVPRIEGASQNVYLQDTARIKAISGLMRDMVEVIVSDEYRIEPQNAVSWDGVQGIEQDYVNVLIRLFRLSQTF